MDLSCVFLMQMASFLPAAVLLLLLLSSALGQLLSGEERTLCTLETQRLYHCASYTSPKSLLTPKQQQICCDAVRSLHDDGCFWCAGCSEAVLLGITSFNGTAAGTTGHLTCVRAEAASCGMQWLGQGSCHEPLDARCAAGPGLCAPGLHRQRRVLPLR
jgi:hypothetical protein